MSLGRIRGIDFLKDQEVVSKVKFGELTERIFLILNVLKLLLILPLELSLLFEYFVQFFY